MKKFIFTADSCRLPVVNMMTGRVLARSITPYFDNQTLALKYFALNKDESGYDRLYLPFESLCFINDVCTMIRLPEKAFTPDSANCCTLIGSPLSARVGAVALFNFGSIAKAEVDENGAISSITLDDGNSFMIPGADSPEKAAANTAFASENLRSMMNSVRVAPGVASAASPEAAKSAPAADDEVSFAYASADAKNCAAEESEEISRTVKEEAAAPKKSAASSSSSKSKSAKKSPAKKTSLFKNKSKAKSKTKSETDEQAGTKRERGTLGAYLLRFVPPIAAMLVYFFLYFFFFTFFIK